MSTRDIIFILVALFAGFSLVATRIMFLVKGKRLKAIVKTYVENQAYFPIMEFEYNGEMIDMKTYGGFKKKKYPVGTELDILYIPGKTEGVKIVSDYTDLMYASVFIVCSIVIIIAGILR